MDQDKRPPAGGDVLRFDAPASGGPAQGADTVCTMCAAPIAREYFEVGGSVTCRGCKSEVERQLARGGAWPAIRWGSLGAFVGAGVYYAVAALTGYEFALIAILVGFLVGAGVRRGAAGKFGRRYKLIAVGLTYLAIGATYVPFILKGVNEAMESSALGKRAAGAIADSAAPRAATRPNLDVPEQDTSSDPQEADATDLAATPAADSLAPAAAPAVAGAASASASATPVGKLPIALGFLIFIVGLLLLALLAPILGIIFGLPASILSAIIMAVALNQAWRMNSGEQVSITGPYRLGDVRVPAA